MLKRKSWKDYGKEEKALALQRVTNHIASLEVKDRPITPKQWRELAYRFDVPEMHLRSKLDPSMKDYDAQQRERARKRKALKVPGKRT